MLALLLAAPARADHVPFAPPEGEALAYRLEIATSQRLPGVADAQSAAGLPEFRFARDGDGWRLTITDEPAEITATDPGEAALLRALALAMGPQQREIMLDATGAPTGIANLEALRTNLVAALTRLAADPPPGVDSALARTLATFWADSSADRVQSTLLDDIAFAFGHGGTPVAADGPLRRPLRLTIDLLGRDLPVEPRVTVSRLADGRLQLETLAEAHPEALKPLVEAWLATDFTAELAAIPEEDRANFAIAWRALLETLRVTSRAVVDLDPATGLPLDARLERRGTAAIGELTLETLLTGRLTRLP